MSKYLIIITGTSGTSKTMLGHQIADELRLPFVNKNTIENEAAR